MSASHVGRLLVATPKLADANFARAVVFMIAHDEDGAFGIILNRPLNQADLADMLPQWRALAALPKVAFSGGPVDSGMALALARRRSDEPFPGWTPVPCDAGLLDLTSDPLEPGLALTAVRVFSGYAGWGAGQLDHEVSEDAWFVIEPRPEDLFSEQPERLFHDVLRRQQGALAMFAHYPADPGVN
ncbi:MAG: YqgE/AlgH family protein [Tepidiformaceae bacterium]